MGLEQQQRISSIVTQFRAYDECIRRWLQGFPVKDDGSPVPIVFATPDRAFSAVANLLKIAGFDAGKVNYKSIPLPFISVTSPAIQFDGGRFHGPVNMIAGWTKDRKTTYQNRFPIPYNITYRVEFWTKNMESMNAFKYWMAVDYMPGYENFLTVDLSSIWPGWSNKIVPITNNGMRFVGEHEPESGHRVIRMVAEFDLRGWIVPPLTETKTVQEIISGFYVAETRVDLDSVDGATIDTTDGIVKDS